MSEAKFEEGIHMATLRKTSKLKFFKDLSGERVAMNSKRLTEIKLRTTPWYTTPQEIRRAATRWQFRKDFVHNNYGIKIFSPVSNIWVSFGKEDCGVYSIGCHSFSTRTFRAILRYAGVKNV